MGRPDLIAGLASDTAPQASQDGPLPMIVGPARPDPRVLARMAEPARPLTDDAFIAEFAGCLRSLRLIAGAPQALACIVPGTGTIALESVAVSLLAPGRRVLVLSAGWWGDVWHDICVSCGFRADRLSLDIGADWDLGLLADTLAAGRHQAVLVTHVESSTGCRADIAAIAQVARSQEALCLVDGIAALGAERVALEQWEVDAYVASPQKALAAPAGLALTLLSDRAGELLAKRSWRAPSFSQDLARWLPVMQAMREGRFSYFQTPAGNLIAGLATALDLILGEGTGARAERHRRLRRRLHAGLAGLGIKPLVTSELISSNAITACWLPPNWTAASLVSALAEAGVLVQTGTHPAAGTATFRIGHLGNVSEADIDRTLDALGLVIGAA